MKSSLEFRELTKYRGRVGNCNGNDHATKPHWELSLLVWRKT
jgi:hypothetical protein